MTTASFFDMRKVFFEFSKIFKPVLGSFMGRNLTIYVIKSIFWTNFWVLPFVGWKNLE